jgi:hypothetical protein
VEEEKPICGMKRRTTKPMGTETGAMGIMAKPMAAPTPAPLAPPERRGVLVKDARV